MAFTRLLCSNRCRIFGNVHCLPNKTARCITTMIAVSVYVCMVIILWRLHLQNASVPDNSDISVWLQNYRIRKIVRTIINEIENFEKRKRNTSLQLSQNISISDINLKANVDANSEHNSNRLDKDVGNILHVRASEQRKDKVDGGHGKRQDPSHSGEAQGPYVGDKVNPDKKLVKNLHEEHRRFYPESKLREFPLTTLLSDPYKIVNISACKSSETVDLLFLVISSTVNFESRATIRNTWGNTSQYPDHQVRVVFFLGVSGDERVNEQIHRESVQHGDLVQGHFLDTYWNLTHKAVLAMRWTSEMCGNAKVVVKVDDDTFVNTFQLLSDSANTYSKMTNEILCFKRDTGTSYIQRNVGKWAVDRNYFRNFTHYPFPYCNGFFMILTPGTSQILYEGSKVTPFFWIDDVYLTGLVPLTNRNIRVTALSSVAASEDLGVECYRSKKERCGFVAVITYTLDVMKRMWRLLMKIRNKTQ